MLGKRKGMTTAMKIVIGVMALLLILGIVLAFVRPDLLGFSQQANQTVGESFKNLSDQIK
ncbi:MAG: hypothetical protein SVQ76_01190 [Candidatus Nanohaloarchaea archaeon]|nr:hypothetical protein [Candidatus Nanohaloarchaea archaeon]